MAREPSIRRPSFACRYLHNTATESGNDSNTCQLFREIGLRIDLSEPSRRRASQRPSMQKISAATLTSDFCKGYLSLPDLRPSSSEQNPKQEFMELLLHDDYDVDEESISSAISNICTHQQMRNADVLRIRAACTPKYEAMFASILGSARDDLGVAFLVKLRSDVRDLVYYKKFAETEEEKTQMQGPVHTLQMSKLQTLERCTKNILTSLFRPGVLDLQRITYEETPASIIEQIAFKEAVHPLQSLQDLRTRLGPGRRCFAFFHPALPRKPLVFVHVALLEEMPRGMSDLQYASEGSATCAAFYSITNTERGLAGVDLGNHLIKSVVQVLSGEFPKISTFCTLSPIPNFRRWLEGKITRYQSEAESCTGTSLKFIDDGLFTDQEMERLHDAFPSSESPLLDLLNTLKSPSWHTDDANNSVSELADQLKPLLMKLAAYYLTVETHHGRPLCPVAKFHIRNGSEMFRLNYLADCTPKGTRNSCGMMINYHYVLDEIEENRVQYEIDGVVAVRDGVRCWLNEDEACG